MEVDSELTMITMMRDVLLGSLPNLYSALVSFLGKNL